MENGHVPEATHPLYVMVNLALGGEQSTDDTPNPSYSVC